LPSLANTTGNTVPSFNQTPTMSTSSSNASINTYVGGSAPGATSHIANAGVPPTNPGMIRQNSNNGAHHNNNNNNNNRLRDMPRVVQALQSTMYFT
jgi:hypothetical protein